MRTLGWSEDPAGTRQPGRGPVPDERCARLLAGLTDRVERVLASVTQVGAATVALAAMARAAGTAGRPLRRADLAALRAPVAGVLREHAELAVGAGVVLAPGVLADAPRCIQWWWADKGSGLEQLEVDLDPDSAEFYDYTTTEWYRLPESTGRPSVAGPYVDYICTHEYTLTASVPLLCAGRFAGVAGADILVSQVERLDPARAGPAGPGRGHRQRQRPGHHHEHRGHPARGARRPAAGLRRPGARGWCREPGLGLWVLPWSLLSQPG